MNVTTGYLPIKFFTRVNKKIWRDGEYLTLLSKKKFFKCLIFTSHTQVKTNCD